MDWTKFSDSDLELELRDRYGATIDFGVRGLMILALETTSRAVAAETARDSCYHAAAEMSGWLSTANKAVEVVSARAAELDAELAAIRFATNMPDDYEYGLPSWIWQYLYASYIGASFSEAVLNRIREGRLTFPEAPIHKRAAELEAALDAERDARRWRPVTEPPEKAGDYAVMVDGWPDSIAAHYGPVLKGSSEDWEWVWVDFDGEIIPVVCWQSLPAAIHPAVG